MPTPRVVALTLVAMVAFAANSLLCRAALRDTAIDAATFTAVRVAGGAAVLALLLRLRARGATAAGAGRFGGSWGSALALVAYAAGFSFAYRELSTATGALLLFGAVQAAMVGHGLATGERLSPAQWAGLAVALAGLVAMLAPGLEAPPPFAAASMIIAGLAWSVYSLRGRGAGEPVAATTGNFVRGVPLALAVSLASAVAGVTASWDAAGLALALASGALTSGLGYVVWYAALPGLTPTQAASVQLAVPVLAALGGVAVLGEAPSLRLAVAAIAVIGGIAIVIRGRR